MAEDPNKWTLRIALSLSGAFIGSLIAIAIDPPKNKRDYAKKIFVGFFTGIILTPLAVGFFRQFTFFTSLPQIESDIFQASVTSILSICGFYIAKMIVNFGKKRQNKDILETLDEVNDFIKNKQ